MVDLEMCLLTKAEEIEFFWSPGKWGTKQAYNGMPFFLQPYSNI